jgi:hypothetical protein
MSNKDIYLVAYYTKKARPGVNTSVKGWMDNPDNLQFDERVEITRGEKKSAIHAGVVLNLSKKSVDRNRYGALTGNFDEFFKYFFKGYHQYVTQVMTQLDAEYFNKMLDEMQAEYDKEQAEKAPEAAPAE